MINERIQLLREEMKKRGIHMYVVPTADFHQSEYVGEYFKCREFLTGFTGSAGTAVITMEEANLWTDGRYFLQAEQELQGTTVILRKSGEPGVPKMVEYLEEKVKHYAMTDSQPVTIGFDGRTMSISQGTQLENMVRKVNGRILYEEDLVDVIWKSRPSLSQEPIFPLDVTYAGETVESKISRLREVMEREGADLCLVTALDDIGWLLNMRGNDVTYCPVFLSYALVSMEQVELYVEKHKFSQESMAELKKQGVCFYPYDQIYERVKQLSSSQSILLDSEQVNYALYCNLPMNVEIVQRENPIMFMKSMKNEKEIEHIRQAHLKDGIACTKFMYWLKTQVGKQRITEMTASYALDEFRSLQEHYLGESFEPILAYKEHGAIVHYASTPDTDVKLLPEGMILCDTGGHYLEGSTDITRTIVLGEITEEMKMHYTTVVCSMLRLADAKFLYGCSGVTLDYAAREPFWRQNLNFNHGTGHGVGYLGTIHEPPARFSWRVPSDRPQLVPILEPGMVITDEPGIYIEGSHGIRIENELLVSKGVKNEYGQFLHFETLTFVPIDLDGILPEQMTEQEKTLLNTYHLQVRERISPYLTEDERNWLYKYTRFI